VTSCKRKAKKGGETLAPRVLKQTPARKKKGKEGKMLQEKGLGRARESGMNPSADLRREGRLK